MRTFIEWAIFFLLAAPVIGMITRVAAYSDEISQTAGLIAAMVVAFVVRFLIDMTARLIAGPPKQKRERVDDASNQ